MGAVRAVLWVVSVAGALVAGTFGSWMMSWAAGQTVVVQVDQCFVYYGVTETVHYRCEGYWQVTPAGRSPDAVRGPVIGMTVDQDAPLKDPNHLGDLGYEIVFTPTSRFATLNGDAATVIPTSHLVLGPLGVGLTAACGAVLIARRRRDEPGRAAKPGPTFDWREAFSE